MNTQIPDDQLLNSRQKTRPGMTLREAILTHLQAYAPAAVGPSAWDVALVLCAGLTTVDHELHVLEGMGKVRALKPDSQGDERWELVDYSGPPWDGLGPVVPS